MIDEKLIIEKLELYKEGIQKLNKPYMKKYLSPNQFCSLMDKLIKYIEINKENNTENLNFIALRTKNMNSEREAIRRDVSRYYWTRFYLNNPHRYFEDYLKIKLRPIDKMILLGILPKYVDQVK